MAEFPIAILEAHILGVLRLDAVLPALFALMSPTFSLSESESLSTSRTMENFFRLHVKSSWMKKSALTVLLRFVGWWPGLL